MTQAYGSTTISPGHLYVPLATATILILETGTIDATVQTPGAYVSDVATNNQATYTEQ